MEVPLASASKCELRSVIRFLSAKKVTPIEIHRQLVEVYGEKCMDIKNVRKWSREFNSGRTNVHDEERSGRPSVSDAIVQAVEAEMIKNRRATIRDLEEKLEGVCSSETIRHNLVNNLQKFESDAEVQKEVNTWLREADGEWYSAGIDKLIVRMRKVLEKNGDYVEK
ncbi:protein GVQW3-like [Anopheles funestus]|uniref:protein GVQW3-like n=1 Tax=Anopheles funestus TaxID=62324 RepID=UPI0020C5DD9C|nr:protein GVQW3-like [Anopheles funestus]